MLPSLEEPPEKIEVIPLAIELKELRSALSNAVLPPVPKGVLELLPPPDKSFGRNIIAEAQIATVSTTIIPMITGNLLFAAAVAPTAV